MGALIRTLTDRQTSDLQAVFGVPDCTTSAMKEAITEWLAVWFQRKPDEKEDPCQRLPYAIVNKLCKATFAEYDSGLRKTSTPKQAFMDQNRRGLDAVRRELMQWAMVGGEAYLRPAPEQGGIAWQVVRRDGCLVLGRAQDGTVTDIALSEKHTVGHRCYTLLERRTAGADGRLRVQNRLFESNDPHTLGRRVPLGALSWYQNLPEEYTFQTPIGGVGLVQMRMPIINCVDGSRDGVSILEPVLGLIHAVNANEHQLGREFELGRARVIASADMLHTYGEDFEGRRVRRRLEDDLFVGLPDSPSEVGLTIFSPGLRNANYDQRRQVYLKAMENLLGIKRGILSDAEVAERTATEVNSSAGDYALSIMELQSLWYDALQQALSLAEQIGRAYGLCDGSAWDPNDLTVTWGNGVLYDADKEWERLRQMVADGLLKPELALAWKYDLPSETEQDLAFIRQKYMPELADLER